MKKIAYGLTAFIPMLAFAQEFGNITTAVTQIGGIVALIIPIMFALAIIYFFWGLIKFIRSAGDPKAASEGKSIMIYGIIALAIMVSVYGLINWLTGTLALSNTAPTLPTIPTN